MRNLPHNWLLYAENPVDLFFLIAYFYVEEDHMLDKYIFT